MASIMAQLERMALAVPNAVCHRAQQLVAIDGADSNVTKQITDICAAATRADVEEYIVRNSSGRPRPSDIPVVGAEPSLLDDHRVALVSIQPVRIWEVDLHLRQVTIRTAREEVRIMPVLDVFIRIERSVPIRLHCKVARFVKSPGHHVGHARLSSLWTV